MLKLALLDLPIPSMYSYHVYFLKCLREEKKHILGVALRGQRVILRCEGQGGEGLR